MTTLLDWLERKYPTAKRTTLRRMVAAGRVRIDGVLARRIHQPLSEKQTVRVVGPGESPQSSSRPPAPAGLRIVHEDADVLVIDKPAGLLTSTVPGERRPTALAMVQESLSDREPRARVGLIHRLDRDAAGLLVFSKNPSAYRSLKSQLFHHTIRRIYTAIVVGIPNRKRGGIESRLVELPDGSVRSSAKPGGGQRAVSEYQVLKELDGAAVLRVTLHTGRKHQIRVQLSEMGTPILGDPVYGTSPAVGPMMLAATRLSFTHPRTGQRMDFSIPLPPYMHRLCGGDPHLDAQPAEPPK